jgi:hypothetical protein
LCWSCGEEQHSYEYFERFISADIAGRRVEGDAMTDEISSTRSLRESERLPRHRQLLAETELFRLFNHIVEQPVPKELLDLLQRIDTRLDVKGVG